MSQRVQRLRQRIFADTPNDWQTYHKVLADHLKPGQTVLDIGCGKGEIAPFPWSDFSGLTLIGLDPDPMAAGNPNLSSFVLLENSDRWDVPDESIDLACARYVLEHVADPSRFFAELTRVLRPGGYFIFLTPNRRHPTMIASRWLPQTFKARYLARTKGLASDDVFPTHYRLNTRGTLEKSIKDHGLSAEMLMTREFQPNGYLDSTLLGFGLSYSYYRVVVRSGLERWLGASIVGSLRKEPSPSR